MSLKGCRALPLPLEALSQKLGATSPPTAIFSSTFHFRNDDVDYDSEQTGMLGGAGVVGQGRKVI